MQDKTCHGPHCFLLPEANERRHSSNGLVCQHPCVMIVSVRAFCLCSVHVLCAIAICRCRMWLREYLLPLAEKSDTANLRGGDGSNVLCKMVR